MRDQTSSPRRKTKFNTILGAVLKVLFSLVLALIFSIAIEIVGMNMWWEEEGIMHSRQMLQYELDRFSEHANIIELSETQLKVVSLCLAGQKEVVRLANLSEISEKYQNITNDFNFLPKSLRAFDFSTFESYVEATINITKVFALRLATLVLSIPLFAIILLVGFVDGLVERDLRKWGAGRESSTVFQLARSFIGPLAIGAWVVYLGIPFSINPNYIILPFAILFGMSVRVTTERMKKYF